MSRPALLFLAAAAFLAGHGVAADDDPATITRILMRRQKRLYGDIEKIQKAVGDVLEIRAMREGGDYVLNDEEKRMERQGRLDFHIFMERYRNDTLRVLAILDRALGKERYVDPLRRKFGKKLDQIVAVNWHETSLEEIVDELVGAYGVDMYVRGDVDIRRTISMHGEMSLLAILLQIENVFDCKLVEDEGELWFTNVSRKPPPEPDGK